MDLSVIVCTRNRAQAIVGCLDSIARAFANASPVEAEIVVVDNASDDDTSAVVEAWAKSSVSRVKLLCEPRKGLSNARNCGILAAQGQLLAFTDDDCRLSGDYVKDLLRHDANDTEPVLRGGCVKLGDPADLPLSIKTTALVLRRSLEMKSARHEHIGDTLIGCNMTMRREVTQRLGLFDVRFGAGSRIPGGEETDYIYRAYLAGIAIEYVPDMTVYHFHGRRGIAEGKALVRNYAIGTGALYAKYLFTHGNLCRPLYWDLKKALREMVTGENAFLPSVQFSHTDWATYCMVGMMRYFRIALTARRVSI